MEVFVARQAIFDRGQEVYAYELLFRSGLANYYDALDANRATEEVIANSFFVIGFDKLTDGKLAIIKFPRRLLVEGVAALLPPDAVAIEIMPDVEPDGEVLFACHQLKKSGFTIVGNSSACADDESPLLDIVDIVKVDFMATSPEQRETLCETLLARGVQTLATKVETAEEHKHALDCGYTYFQGYFLGKPVVKTGHSIVGNKSTYLQALEKANRPDVSYDDLEDVIKHDSSLTYKLLRLVNSAWFSLRYEIHSVHHALVVVGANELRKWLSLRAVRDLLADKPQELIYRMAVRGRMAEQIAPLVGMADCGSRLFLLGMFSLIDALVDLPLKEALAQVPIDEEVKKALLDEDNRFRPIRDVIVAYECGNWDDFARHAETLGLQESLVPDIYAESLTWADEACAPV